MGFAGLHKGWVLRDVDGSIAPAGLPEPANWYNKAAIRDKCVASALVKFDFVDAKIKCIRWPESARLSVLFRVTKPRASQAAYCTSAWTDFCRRPVPSSRKCWNRIVMRVPLSSTYV